MKGQKLVALEGIDGSGKTVQLEMLKNWLTNAGYTVETRDYPVYSSFIGKELGRRLSGESECSANQIDPKSMALWFAADRAGDMKKRANQKSDAEIVLLNRFVLSNVVYQSARLKGTAEERDMLMDWILKLEHDILGIPQPDLYLYFDINTSVASDNVSHKGYRDYVGNKKDVYEDSSDMQSMARAGYLRCAEKYNNVAVIDCMDGQRFKTRDEICGIVISTLKQNNII